MKRKSKTQEIRETKMCHVSDVPKMFPLTARLLSESGTIQENQDPGLAHAHILVF